MHVVHSLWAQILKLHLGRHLIVLTLAIQADEILPDHTELRAKSPVPEASTDPSFVLSAKEELLYLNISGDRTSSTESLEAVAGVITQLQRLSCAIRESSIHSRHSKASVYIIKDEDGNDVTPYFKQLFLSIVKSRFSRVSHILCERLADSMLLRRRRFLYLAKHQDKLSGTKETRPSEDGPDKGSDHTRLKYAVSLQQSQTTASVFDPQKFELRMDTLKSERSVSSSKSAYGYNQSEYPGPPALKFDESECTCPYCYNTLSKWTVLDEKRWRFSSLSSRNPSQLLICLTDVMYVVTWNHTSVCSILARIR